MQPPQNSPYGSAYGDNQAPVPQYGVSATPGQPGPLQAAPLQAYPYGAGQQAYGAGQPPLFGPSVPVPEQYAADYSASIGTAFKRYFKRGFTFKGYASRREFWLAALLNILIVSGLMIVLAAGVGMADRPESAAMENFGIVLIVISGIAYTLYALATVVPSIAVGVRRLHDAGYSGLMYLICLVPFGSLVLLILYMQPTRPERWRAEWHM